MPGLFLRDFAKKVRALMRGSQAGRMSNARAPESASGTSRPCRAVRLKSATRWNADIAAAVALRFRKTRLDSFGSGGLTEDHSSGGSNYVERAACHICGPGLRPHPGGGTGMGPGKNQGRRHDRLRPAWD